MLKSLLIGAVGAALMILGLQSGVISFGLPDVLRTLPRNLAPSQSVTVGDPADHATVVRVEPVALDCRARIHAEVRVTGREDHRLAGLTYRTDTVTVDAEGDVDTCVDARAAEVTTQGDGSVLVTVPGEAIRFVRPRVDMVASAAGVDYHKGLVGELADLVPGVDPNADLVGGAFAHAQQVIGGSACMSSAYEVTRQALSQAYADQLVAQGIDPGMVTVQVEEPDFEQHLPPEEVAGTTYEVAGPIRCTMAPDAHAGAFPDWRDLAPQG